MLSFQSREWATLTPTPYFYHCYYYYYYYQLLLPPLLLLLPPRLLLFLLLLLLMPPMLSFPESRVGHCDTNPRSTTASTATWSTLFITITDSNQRSRPPPLYNGSSPSPTSGWSFAAASACRPCLALLLGVVLLSSLQSLLLCVVEVGGGRR